MKIRSELLMVERALKSGWAISAQARADALRLVESVLADTESTVREVRRAESVRQLLEATE